MARPTRPHFLQGKQLKDITGDTVATEIPLSGRFLISTDKTNNSRGKVDAAGPLTVRPREMPRRLAYSETEWNPRGIYSDLVLEIRGDVDVSLVFVQAGN